VASSAYPNIAGSVLSAFHFGQPLAANQNIRQRLVPGALAQTNPTSFGLTYIEQ